MHVNCYEADFYSFLKTISFFSCLSLHLFHSCFSYMYNKCKHLILNKKIWQLFKLKNVHSSQPTNYKAEENIILYLFYCCKIKKKIQIHLNHPTCTHPGGHHPWQWPPSLSCLGCATLQTSLICVASCWVSIWLFSDSWGQVGSQNGHTNSFHFRGKMWVVLFGGGGWVC